MENTDKKINDRRYAQQNYAGAAIDRADDNKTTEREVKQDTRMLNNNPRNSK